jgi:hypothetical protein
MTNTKELKLFLIKARTQTYAGSDGTVKAALEGSKQLEYRDGDWFYRDVFYTGKNAFDGIEAVFYKNKPIFSMSYYGNWGEMTEEEIDQILRGALISNPETRLSTEIEWKKDKFIYTCVPDFSDDIERVGGAESISKDGEQIYEFYYAGGVLI